MKKVVIIIPTYNEKENIQKLVPLIENEIFPILINSKNPRDFAFGFVLEVSEEELKKIDKYEGDEYKRKKVILNSGKESWVYVKQTY